MKVYTEISIRNFDFWAGAIETAKKIDEAEAWDILETELEEYYPDGLSETELNDLFWFDDDFILSLAGIYEDEEEED